MKSVDKKDLPKLYVLIACVVGIVGYFIYSMTFGAETPASAAGNKKDTAPVGTAVAAKTPADGVAPVGTAPAPDSGQPPAFKPELVGPPQGGRDPFQPVGPGVATPAPPASVANNATPPPTIVPPLFTAPPPARPERQRLPSDMSSLLNVPNGGKASETVQPVEMEAAPAPSMTVTGVVLGDPTSGNPRNIAIMRGGAGEERRFVSVGDYIGNGYTVVAVHADGVEIQDKVGNHRVTIKLGQPGDNARAN